MHVTGLCIKDLARKCVLFVDSLTEFRNSDDQIRRNHQLCLYLCRRASFGIGTVYSVWQVGTSLSLYHIVGSLDDATDVRGD